MELVAAREVKERPIIMQAESVRAIMEGRKTQTRRVVKPQPEGGFVASDGVTNLAVTDAAGKIIACRYGGAGDQLWVKETWRKICLDEPTNLAEKKTEDGDIRYRATSPHGLFGEVWRPSMFMPRWASRITLRICVIRLEQIQDITADDCAAEGSAYPVTTEGLPKGKCHPLLQISGKYPACRYFEKKLSDSSSAEEVHLAYSRAYFASRWDTINFKRGFPWESNPWVWVIEFKRIAPAAAVGE